MEKYITLVQSSTGKPLYNAVIRDGQRTNGVPVQIRNHTPRNVLSVAMSYANDKGLPFRLVAGSGLLDEATAVANELAQRYGIRVTVEVSA